ncbi:triacylglycerol lipase OBL1-like [Magnolia sinica]|uniref:triacylglycerol lipase OBL1-like n=1 Tax=Magnolia sinica TaxID=86752 RepID=UPI00265AF3E9|nr:triacylglycerol lipase OBL1-like [Magnolia sinica]
MASPKSSGYMIFHPEKAGLLEIFSLCLFKRKLSDCNFIETTHETKLKLENVRVNWLLVGLTFLLQKILSLIEKPLALFGEVLEFILNLFSLNGGFFALIFRVFTGSVVTPKKDSADYRSALGFIDGRLDLYKTSSLLSYLPQMGPVDSANNIKLLDLCMMASKVVYENEAYVKNAVTKHWQMQFVGFYDCWNVFDEVKGTQAFIFCDQPEDAKMIVVAFRGTEPFNAKDWSTDVDLSFISMGDMGQAHLGFMKGLGLQDEKDYLKGWPKDYQGEKDKPLAYYIIRDTLKSLLLKHKNAKILVTGHSLGGALAAIFPSILILHEETTILNSLWGIVTYGQPRVGDETFASYVETHLNSKLCYRVVYSYDVVPRVPFDGPFFEYKHYGWCIYFNSWYDGKVMREAPNKNYFNPIYLLSKYYHAWSDLIKSLFLGKTRGPDFKESGTSTAFRLVGLIIPGLASHSPRDYVNAARLGKISKSVKEMV